MKTMTWRSSVLAAGVVFAIGAMQSQAGAPDYDPSKALPCERKCLQNVMDRFTDAMLKHDPKGLPLSQDPRVTENTAQLALGEGLLWRGNLAPTTFKYSIVDPLTGGIVTQAVYDIDGKPALVAIRLKVERHEIMEVEQLVDRNVAPEAMELLQAPRARLVNDVAPNERSTRSELIAAANSYFDALTGDNGGAAAFADDCVRHENGYQTVNNRQPGHASPSPKLPDTSTPNGRFMSAMSTMTCKQQIDTKAFTHIKKIWPRRLLVVDEQRGLVAAFPLFIHDGTRRPSEGYVGFPDLPKPTGLAMMLNMVTCEVFGIRGGKIHEVEAFPFITFQYGLGDGWTLGSGR